MSSAVDVEVGDFGIPDARELISGAFAQEGPETFTVSWALIGVLAYLSSAVGLIVTFLVGLFATGMVALGLLWILVDRVR